MAWPPNVDDLRQEITTERSDTSLRRILQAAVNVVGGYGLDAAVSENHALQLAVVDVQFDATRVETKRRAQVVKEHARARNALLIELSRLRQRRERGLDAGGAAATMPATVPEIAAAPTDNTPVLYLTYNDWKARTHSTTPPKRADGQIDQARVTALLTDASAWCAGTIPGTLIRRGQFLPVADVPAALLAVLVDVCRDLVDHRLSPRTDAWRDECAACEERAAERLRAVAMTAPPGAPSSGGAGPMPTPAAGGVVPEPTGQAGDAGKVPALNAGGTAYELSAQRDTVARGDAAAASAAAATAQSEAEAAEQVAMAAGATAATAKATADTARTEAATAQTEAEGRATVASVTAVKVVADKAATDAAAAQTTADGKADPSTVATAQAAAEAAQAEAEGRATVASVTAATAAAAAAQATADSKRTAAQVTEAINAAIAAHKGDADAHQTIPAAPAIVQAFTAAAMTADAAEVIVETVRITPRSATTRVLVAGYLDAAVTAGTSGATRNLGLELRLYRGTNLLIARHQRSSRYAQNEVVGLTLDIEWLDAPNSAAEQTYTLRVLRQGGSRQWTVTDRQLIAREVL